MRLAPGLPLLGAIVVATGARSAWAGHGGSAEDRHECVVAASRGQDLRDSGKLLEAREQFVACARDVCPGVVRTHCAAWLRDTERDMPSIGFRARDASGRDVTDVRVFVDGEPRADSLDGRAIPVDPGPHEFRFVRGDAAVEDTIALRAGEKDRLVDIVFEAPRPPPASASSPGGSGDTRASAPSGGGFRFPLLGGIAAGVGAVSFAAMAALALSASSDANHLRTTCAPNCASSDVDAVNTKVVLANVALGVGAASLGLLAVTLVVANTGHHEEGAAPQTGRLELRVQPRAGGASAALVGAW